MEVARADPEVAAWFAQHCEFQTAIRARFRNIPVPQPTPAILLPPNIVHPQPWWRDARLLAAAAGLVIILSVVAFWTRPAQENRLANFKERMIATAIREYRMDIVTNDMHQVRRYLAREGSPADYQVPSGLEKLQLTGGGVLRWRSKPVSMVCFDRGDKQMLFLFVVDRHAVKDPPPAIPLPGTSHELAVASWTKGDKTYLLAGPPEPGFPQKYL